MFSTDPPVTSLALGIGINITGDLVTYPNNIFAHSLSLTPSNLSTVYNVIVYRGSTIYFQETNITGTKIYTESNFTLNTPPPLLNISKQDENFS